MSRRSCSLFHSITGLWCARAVIAFADGNSQALASSADHFLRAVRSASFHGFDLTLGSAGVSLGCAILLELLSRSSLPTKDVIRLGDEIYADLLRRLQILSKNEPGPLDLTFAHGQPGMIYSAARYAQARSMPLDDILSNAANTIVGLATPFDGGIFWGRHGDENGRKWAWASWCNGAAGTIHMLALLYEMSMQQTYLHAAERAAYFVGRSVETRAPHLCCGLTGQSYALWRVFSITRERQWAKRAAELSELAALRACNIAIDPQTIHGLFSGDAGIVLLARQIGGGVIPEMLLMTRLGIPRNAKSQGHAKLATPERDRQINAARGLT